MVIKENQRRTLQNIGTTLVNSAKGIFVGYGSSIADPLFIRDWGRDIISREVKNVSDAAYSAGSLLAYAYGVSQWVIQPVIDNPHDRASYLGVAGNMLSACAYLGYSLGRKRARSLETNIAEN